MIHAFSRFGRCLNALCCLSFAHILVHISQEKSAPAALPGGPPGGASGNPCGGLARLRRATRLASPVAVPATDAGPLINALAWSEKETEFGKIEPKSQLELADQPAALSEPIEHFSEPKAQGTGWLCSCGTSRVLNAHQYR